MRRIASIVLALAVSCQPLATQAQLRGTDESAPPIDLGVPLYHLKPPEISVPPGTKPGALRRIIQPFGPWTLICDEDLKAHKRLCNISQSVVDAAGHVVFSWSLAATRSGTPVFILRAPSQGASTQTAHLDFGQDTKTSVDVTLSSCDASVCIGFLPDNPGIQRQINGGAKVRVRVPIGSIETSFEGLAAAVASLK